MCRVQTTFADLQVVAFCFDLVWFESRLYAVRDRRSLVSDVLMLACPAACPAAFPPSFLLGSIVCDVFCSLFHCVQQLASRVRINGLCSGFAWRQLKLVFVGRRIPAHRRSFSGDAGPPLARVGDIPGASSSC